MRLRTDSTSSTNSPLPRQTSASTDPVQKRLSRTIVLDDESAPYFKELLAQFTADHQPATPTERALVTKLVVSWWRQIRLWSIEKTILEQEMAAQPSNVEPPVVRASHAFRQLADRSLSTGFLNRLENAYDRQFFQCLNRLQKSRRPSTGDLAPKPTVTPTVPTKCKDLPNEPVPAIEHLEKASPIAPRTLPVEPRGPP